MKTLSLRRTGQDQVEIYKVFVEVVAWRDMPDEAGALTKDLLEDFHYMEVSAVVDRFGGTAETLMSDDRSAWTHYVFHHFDDGYAAFEEIMRQFRRWEMTGALHLQVWRHTIGPSAYMYATDSRNEEINFLVGEPFDSNEKSANPRAHSYYPDIDLEMFDEIEP